MKACFFLFLLFCIALANAQVTRCATETSFKQRAATDPAIRTARARAEQRAKQWFDDNGTKAKLPSVVTIPVVVHVVYYTGDSMNQNLPDSVILSQIDVLNHDYRMLNADTVNRRPVFDSLAADIQVEFCLASLDPNGNPTNGIDRVPTATSSFFTTPLDNSVKSSSTGGADPWPADSYLNIWTCDMSFLGNPVVLGYAQFPGDNPATDGVVIQYSFFGRTQFPASDTLNYGRTATHEIGHWLGLRHIWGDGACDSTDYVDDTPNADAASQTDCNLSKNTCSDTANPFWSPLDPPDMVENYMDYSRETCMNMFTKGQKARMWSFLNTDRLSIQSSTDCAPNGIVEAKHTSIRLYPNPVSDHFKLTGIDNGYYVIVDVTGRMVQQGSILQNRDITVTGLSGGYYTLLVRSGKQKWSHKLVIQEY